MVAGRGMKSLKVGSIGKNLVLLVMLAVLPALAILLYTGMEQRRNSIEHAKHDVLLLSRAMAEAQKDITNSVRAVLSTLSLLPEIQCLEKKACSAIFKAVLAKNSDYINIALTDLNGDVIASGKPFQSAKMNLADRKHFQDALKNKDFAVGEYIVARVGTTVPAFAFAYPVFDKYGRTVAVLTTAIKLEPFSHYHDISTLPAKSFVAITDHQGIRLFYHPPNATTNPIGKPIKASAWQKASQAETPGMFFGTGSDGVRRIFAFDQVRLSAEDSPYIYVWAGIPDADILGAANGVLIRNVLLILITTGMALFISWLIGKKTLLSPIQNLLSLTRTFAEGNLEARIEQADKDDEFGTLTRAFHDMANSLTLSQETVQENEARFRLLLDSLNALVYVADMETYEVLFINEYGKKLFGNIAGKLCWQTIQQGQDGPCSFCTNRYLVDGSGKPGEVYIWECQNTVTGLWFYIQDRAIKWDDDRLVRLEVATDITERKMAEEKLAEESERLAVTLRSIADGVITTDTEGRVVLMNKVAETLTGWDGKEANGRVLADVFKIVDKETGQPCASPVEKVLSSGDVIALASSTLLVSGSGKEINIADSAAPIRGKDGKIIGVVLVFRDITEQLRTQQELVKIKKIESIGILAGGIAHDFNNILVAVLGNIDLSLLDSSLTLATRHLLEEAAKASQRARELTQQLLTFAKGGEPIKETASLIDVIKDSAEFILRGGKVACRYSFPQDLWLVDIDTGQISQVVQNIILNASNAMADGGTIEVTCKNVGAEQSKGLVLPKVGNYVSMRFRDNGVGIPMEILDKIFDPYFSTKRQGSGLGLAITHSIVSKHGGHITVSSTEKVGTTFTVYIPVSGQTLKPVREKKADDDNIKKCRLLVMDDEEQVRNLFKAMLKRMGHEVELAEDGLQAAQLYKQAMESNAPFDLVIMDLTVPGGMGGKDAVRELLTIDPEAKVIVASGYSNDPVMANFKEYGFSSAIMKPFQSVDLKRCIEQLLVCEGKGFL